MSKNKIEFIVQIIATIFFLFTLDLPSEMHVIKGVGNFILIILISKYNLKKVLSQGSKKDITILIISYVILCVTIVLPTDMYIVRMTGLFLFAIILFKEDIKYLAKRFRNQDSG